MLWLGENRFGTCRQCHTPVGIEPLTGLTPSAEVQISNHSAMVMYTRYTRVQPIRNKFKTNLAELSAVLIKTL